MMIPKKTEITKPVTKKSVAFVSDVSPNHLVTGFNAKEREKSGTMKIIQCCNSRLEAVHA